MALVQGGADYWIRSNASTRLAGIAPGTEILIVTDRVVRLEPVSRTVVVHTVTGFSDITVIGWSPTQGCALCINSWTGAASGPQLSDVAVSCCGPALGAWSACLIHRLIRAERAVASPVIVVTGVRCGDDMGAHGKGCSADACAAAG